ncbi:hypothetical protein D3C72_1338060 [compost metagenome]
MDDLRSIRSHDVATDDTICFLISNDFHEALRITFRTSTAIRHEWEFTHIHFNAFFFGLLFRQTHSCDLRVSVDHSRNCVVIHVTSFTNKHLCKGNAFFFRFMRKHRARDNVTDSIDTRDVRLIMFIDDHATLWVFLHADFFKAQTTRKGFTARGYQNHVGLHRTLFAVRQ